jgi:hypothetical protein
MIPPTLDQYITVDLEFDHIPIQKMPTCFYEISLKGWSPLVISADDDNLTQLISICSGISQHFVKRYAKTHMLSFQFGIKVNNDCFLKIYTLEKQ